MASAEEPTKAIVVVNLHEKDFVSMTGIRMRKRIIPVADYDLKEAFTRELMDRLVADKRMQYRLAKPEDNIPVLPDAQGHLLSAKAYKQSVPANLDASLILRVEIDTIGSVSGAGTTFYFLDGSMVMLNRTGKVVWLAFNYISDWQGNAIPGKFPDWQVGVAGNVDQHQADNQKLMKENINKIIEKYCASKVGKILGKDFKGAM
jgi:hypothetical protein